MFTTLSSFSVFFFTVATLLLIGIIFEEKFLKLEDKFDNFLARKKREKKMQQISRYRSEKMRSENTRTKAIRTNSEFRKHVA